MKLLNLRLIFEKLRQILVIDNLSVFHLKIQTDNKDSCRRVSKTRFPSEKYCHSRTFGNDGRKTLKGKAGKQAFEGCIEIPI